MRFKTDENLPAEVADLPNQAGHDALRVDQQGLSGVADPGVAAVCLVEQRAINTLDTDFMDIRRYPPEDYAGIIVLRPHWQTVPRILRLTRSLIRLLALILYQDGIRTDIAPRKPRKGGQPQTWDLSQGTLRVTNPVR
jgi:predicted nuclease of predicted toxin-antitoxin system